ncbi:MAG: MFS transporter [Oscillospiraceae bacterium]|nr:MFS transporter [Oscillospiraceae bacterium]
MCYALAFFIHISFSLYMTELGYSSILLATMLSIVSGMLLLTRFIIPRIINRAYCHKAMIISTAASVIGAAVFFYAPGLSPLKAFCYTVLAIGGYQVQMSLSDPWIMKIMETDKDMDYGKVRSFGSIAYAVAAVAYGWALTKFGIGIAFWSILVFEVVQLAISLTIPDERVKMSTERKGSSWKAILKKPLFLIFVGCYLFPTSIYALLDSYMPVLILEKGGNSFQAGLSSFVMAGLEFIFLMFYSKVADKVGTRKIIVISMIGYAVKAFAVSLAPTPELVIAACVTQIISFCLFMPSIVRFIQETNTPEEAASAYSLLQVIDSLFSTVFTNPVAGLLKGSLGTGPMLCVFGILSAISGVIFLMLTKDREWAAE